jgi:alpha-ketoglutarate-dependent 2,4-dichlorophenoxyacetate dioxygenase
MARVTSDLTITPIHPVLGARVEGVRLADPMDEVTFRRIFDAFQEYSVLVFPDQALTDEQQMAFSRRFGPLETTLQSIGQCGTTGACSTAAGPGTPRGIRA